MKNSRKYALLLISATFFAIPATGQDEPESLLPPGFGDPSPPPPTQAPEPSSAPINNVPSNDDSDQSATPQPPRSSSVQSNNADQNSSNQNTSENDDEEDTELGDDQPIRYKVPTAKRRSLGVVGVINQAQGGFEVSPYTADGAFMMRLARNLKAPFVSRWTSIMMRRLLMSKTSAPNDIDGADWVAERAWILLRMGESVAARYLIQQVDTNQYSERLYNVAMPIYLANGDLAGLCPLANAASKKTDAPSWKVSRSICFSLSGEQTRANSMLNRARRGKWATGVDYLLAEKALGAGNSRRAVKIEWEGVTGFNAWRHGLSIATGVKPPEKFYNASGRHVRSWLTLAPMVSINDRILSSYAAGANGTLSNAAMVDLFSSAEEDEDVSRDTLETVGFLNGAYTNGNASSRISSMRSLWDGRPSNAAEYSMKVLTARAAARIMPIDLPSEDVDDLISSMMSSGLDVQAQRWSDYTAQGSLGWGLITVGTVNDITVNADILDDFADQDLSSSLQKSAFLAAAWDGFGRIDDVNYGEISERLGVNIRKENKWSKSLEKAVKRADKGAVIFLVAAGLQGDDWSKVPAFHIYHIIKSLKAMDLEAEGRMIAAEAVDRA